MQDDKQDGVIWERQWCLDVFRSQVRYDDEDEDEGPQPDQMLEQGAPIPVRLHNEFPPELASTPLEDIDSFYHNQRVSIFYYETGKDRIVSILRTRDVLIGYYLLCIACKVLVIL